MGEEKFTWGEYCDGISTETRSAQLNQVNDLVTLVKHRAKLCDDSPGFDYCDDESKLEYAVDHGDYELLDYILDDTESIAEVLESGPFSHSKEELLDQWLSDASVEQYRNVEAYATEYKDEELLAHIQEDLSDLNEDEETDSQLSASIPGPSVAALRQSLSSVLQLNNSNTTTTTDETKHNTRQFSPK